MKLKSLTNTKRKIDKPIKKKKVKSKKVKHSNFNTTVYIPLSLNATISKNYQGGISNNLLGVIDSLPKDIKDILENTEITKAKVSHNFSEFILNNRWRLAIKDVTVGLKAKQHLTLKDFKKEMLNVYL
ncbi:MAG: hypothetical protein CMC35_03120 [Flavobacteriaceae bacterium]|nr:hypothetical protein [Flavobacteriaceae bacterium]|tara:strand:- start:418 stop:801 length:384 start_codon:yes stop_codon:yes gene_type:complete